MNRLTIAVIFAIILCSCAKSTLTVSVDIFTGDIPNNSAPRDEIDGVIAAVVKLESISDKVVSDKLDLSEAIFSAYTSYYQFATEARGSSFDLRDLSAFQEMKKEFEEGVYGRKTHIDNVFDQIKDETTSLINAHKDSPEFMDAKLRIPGLLNEQIGFIKSLSEMTHPYVENIKSSFEQDLQDLAAIEPQDVSIPTYNQVKTALSDLANALFNRNFNVNGRVLNDMLQSLETPSFTSFKDSFNMLSSVFAELPINLTLESRATDLAKFVQDKNFLFSQLDRVQDFGNEDWKHIAQFMDTEGFWKREFTSTKFEAEGNSSIVLVRDSPVNFRPQQVNNDPSALIQSQLQISRATTGLALNVAGALGGFDVGSASNVDVSSDESTSTNEGQKAALERRNELRQLALLTLLDNLKSIEEDLEENGSDDTERARILQRVKILTEAYILQFK